MLNLSSLICPDFSQARIIVIGDAMLDRYWHGDASRISPEAPVPVVRIEHNEERMGGAANVAANLRVLGLETALISLIGADETGNRLQQLLKESGVESYALRSSTATTLKLRVLGRNQQLIRLDFEDNQAVDPQAILEKLNAIPKAKVLVLSDYAKGMLKNPQAIIRYACQQQMKVLVDPKSRDFTLYQGAHILTPNLSEFEAAVGPCQDKEEIKTKGLALIEQLQLEALLVTCGSQGMMLIEPEKCLHIPAQAREVFDITGAGDTVIAVLAASLAAGCSLFDAVQLANLAAAIVVGKLGTAAVTQQELQTALSHQGVIKGILSQADLLNEIKRRKAQHHKIVMTNGCFDILHAGHICYLQQARALGDCLIVAVNDDMSVKKLKGPQRPINTLARRMQLLTALSCVDYVVAFSECTPQKLIATILPDILVKGGDYVPEQIAGAQEVLQQGGRIEILPFLPGCSTTQLIERIQEPAGME